MWSYVGARGAMYHSRQPSAKDGLYRLNSSSSIQQPAVDSQPGGWRWRGVSFEAYFNIHAIFVSSIV